MGGRSYSNSLISQANIFYLAYIVHRDSTDVLFHTFLVPVPVVSLNIYDIGPTTMHVQWQPVGGATGYTVSYQPTRSPEGTKPKEVRDVYFLIT